MLTKRSTCVLVKKGDSSTLIGGSLKVVDKFMYLRTSASSTENDNNMRLTKALTAIDKLFIIWKWELSNKIKCNFFQAVLVSILLYGCTIWTLSALKKSLTETAQECYKLCLTNPGSNIPQNSSCTATYIPSLKLLWEPYPSHHNGLFSPLLVLGDFAARGADQYRFSM